VSDVLFEVRDAVGVVTLNRPESLNSWTPDMGRELLATIQRAADDASVRAILIRGAGRAFCAGADVKVPRDLTPEGDPDLSTRLREIYNPVVIAVRAAPKPVIAAVQGSAAGLGCALALACDMVIAAESMYYLLAFVHLGISPDGGSSFLVAERAGSLRAAELMMLGERLPARRALEWGLVNRVVADEDLAAESEALAARLAAGPTVALDTMKRLIGHAAQARFAAHAELEATLQQRHATTADYAEGVASFKEKRRPDFSGH
jgi:2-(1,2-epoxy-1,2-dihydrophenyl)acetyl-CoA isomerase